MNQRKTVNGKRYTVHENNYVSKLVMDEVLVIHAGFGEGHKKAAQAVADAIGARDYDRASRRNRVRRVLRATGLLRRDDTGREKRYRCDASGPRPSLPLR